MNEIEDLEPQQYQQQYWEDDVPLNDVRKSVLRNFVYVGSFLFLLFVLAGSFIKFPDEVQLPFVLKSNKAEEMYRFPYPVYLVEKKVIQGTNVEKGMPLMTITSPEIVALINSYHEAEQNFQNYMQRKPLSLTKQKEIIALSIEKDRLKIAAIKKEISSLDNTWQSNSVKLEFNNNDAEKNLNRNKKLFDSKVISSKEMEEYEVKKVSTADAVVAAKQQYERDRSGLLSLDNQYQLDIISLHQELDKLSLDTKFDSVQLYNQQLLTYNKIKNTFGDFDITNGGLALKANDNGVVSFVFEGDKEVPIGAIVLKVEYSKTSQYAYIASPPSLVGKLQKGQHVFLRVATFPSYEWGAVAGHVDNMSLTADEKGNFNLKVSIDDAKKMKGLLQSGMNGSAIIVVTEKTFFQYFFRSVKKTYYSTTQNN